MVLVTHKAKEFEELTSNLLDAGEEKITWKLKKKAWKMGWVKKFCEINGFSGSKGLARKRLKKLWNQHHLLIRQWISNYFDENFLNKRDSL